MARSTGEIDAYTPPSREAEGPFLDEVESVDPVITTLLKGRPAVMVLGSLGVLGGLVFGACAVSLLQRPSAWQGALYFAGLTAGCLVPTYFVWTLERGLRQLGSVRTKEKVVEVLEAQNACVRLAALAVVMVVVVTAVLALVLISGSSWD